MSPSADDAPGQRHGCGLLETAARHATRQVPVVRPDDTAAQARAALVGHSFDAASHLVVLDGERFCGVLRLEDLLAAADTVPVGTLMDAQPPVVAPGVDQEVAAWTAVRRGESALVVLDDNGRFRGLIPSARLLEVLLAEHDEDLGRLGGFLRATSQVRAASTETVERRFIHRLPWLLLGLIGAMGSADIVGYFERNLEQTVMLAFFIPGMVYLADAVGTQTETVVVRGLSVGVPLRHMVRRELLAGGVIGMALAFMASAFVWLRWEDPAVALVVGLSLLGACSSATVAAIVMPWLFVQSGRDPAFGSGPLATVVQDLLTILIYFSIAALVMG